MDLQGNPIPSGPRSTKVTTDPRAAQQPIEEPSGPVPNDSLAAESVRGGGGFSENRGAQPQGYSSSQLKNPGSASEALSSAPVGGLREDREAQQKYPEALGGQGNFPGAHINGYAGGPTATKKEMGINTGSQAPASGSSQYNAGQAPSYVADVTDGYQHSKPDGRNIHEGGFSTSSAKNASFEAEIGSDQDPGRAAINKFQRSNAESGPDAGRPDQKTLNTDTPYDILQNDQRA
ncbi:hypothetical protein N7456_008165 [Penicillium angulare]|uniref:Uncharacterized protein n=1 Tax=Penicillium angulare TaxID=116970 RepID=A0A9W9FCA9_9EURO|nr:hypothetical protein N7456_008165 [Penicillium angulare]